MEENAETRIAVLEQIAESHERRITDIEDFHREVVDRFDQKIQLDTANQINMERTLSRTVSTLDSLSEALKTVTRMADESSRLALKHETIGATIIKLCTGGAILVSAGWALFTFFKA